MNKNYHTRRRDTPGYITKDRSQISELMHPAQHANRNQSLAEAVVSPGITTLLHRHRESEELYHITAGQGVMRLAEEEFVVTAGDTVCILPGTAHCIHNSGDTDLVILCCCSPADRHEDTELL